jgi:hypothetical protein
MGIISATGTIHIQKLTVEDNLKAVLEIRGPAVMR